MLRLIMDIAGFTFTVSELNGYRLIEAIFPENYDASRLWAVASSYPAVWDESRPSVTLTDVAKIGELEEHAREVLRWVLQQNQIHAQLIATSWVVGDNDIARAEIEAVLESVGRPTDVVFRTRDEAIAYLTGAIEDWVRKS